VRGPRRLAVTAAALAAVVLPAPVAMAAPAVAAPASTVGASGVGDPFFPDAGNGGYDVQHYDLSVAYTPSSRQLAGTARITAVATQTLTRFDLDLRKALTVSRVTVNGLPARFTQQGEQELVVSPFLPLLRGLPFVVTVAYAGVPVTVIDPDGSLDGWIYTADGVFVASEPQGAASWFPGNDHPSDKATFTTHVTVPDGIEVVGNGRLVSRHATAGLTTFVWDERFPMATYLATVTMGTFQVTQGRTASGIPTYVAVDPAVAARANPVLAKLPDIVEYEQGLLGPYPFETVGAIVDNARFVGYALETQTKPVFDRAPSESTLAHELAHQWFGDSVSLETFPQMWLNEGFATYVQELWTEHAGGPTTQQDFDQLYATPADDTDFWNPPSGDPGDPSLLFTTSVYERGSLALHALRVKIGDAAFFRLLRSWAALHRYGNGTIAQFTGLAQRISHRDLRDFFQVWLFTPGKPTSW
jgi:aminopeptidase N